MSAPDDRRASHRSKLLVGGRWLAAVRIAARALAVVKNVIIARLLAPGDLGMVGLVFLCLTMAEAVTTVRMDDALLSTRERIRDNANAAWTIASIRGLALTLVLLAAAGPLVAAVGAPEAVSLLRAIALVPLFRGLKSPMIAQVRFDLDFRRLALLQIGEVMALNVAVIAALLVSATVWSVIVGTFAGEAIGLVLSYVVAPCRPRLERDWARLRRLVEYGAWMTLTGIVLFLSAQLDSWFITIALGLVALGYYEVARRFSVGLLNDIVTLIHSLTTPAYATFADDIALRRRVLLTAVELIAFAAAPVVVFAVIVGEAGVVYVLGDQWRPAVATLQVLAVSGLILGIQTTAGPLFYALGKPERDFYMNLGRPVVLAVSLTLLTPRWGTVGAAVSMVIAATALLPFWLWQIRQLAGVTPMDVVAALLPPCVFAALTAVAMLGAAAMYPAETPAAFAIVTGVGGVAFGGLVLWYGVARHRGPVAWLRGR